MIKFLKNGNKLSILVIVLFMGLFASGVAFAQGSFGNFGTSWQSGSLGGALWNGNNSASQTPKGWHAPMTLEYAAELEAEAKAAEAKAAASGSYSPYSKCQGGNIFQTLRCMIANTLKDIRNIVYIVGGIGLITFTFAAIFGKISFKHLANICISLFLLSMMSPFVSFFTGSETALAELEYGLYLSPENSDVEDSNVTGSCKGGNCPSSSSDVTGGGSVGGQAFVPGEISPLEIQGINLPGASVELPSTIALIPTLTANNTEIDTRTGWQKFKDGINKTVAEGKKAYNTASTVYSAAKNVYNAGKNIHNAGKNAINSIKNADSVSDWAGALTDVLNIGVVGADSVQSIAGNVTMAAGAVGGYTDQKMLNNINSEIERLRQDSQNNPGNVDANNQKIAELQQQAREGTAQSKTENALGGIVNAVGEGKDVFEAGIDIGNTAGASWRLGEDIVSGKGFTPFK